MTNLDIRRAAATEGVKLWQIADRLGMHDTNFSKRLRRELSNEEKKKVLSIISQIAREGC